MEKLLTVKELAEWLQISPSTIYQWTHTGFVPHYKLPKGVRFKEEEIERWLKKRKSNGRSRYKMLFFIFFMINFILSSVLSFEGGTWTLKKVKPSILAMSKVGGFFI